MPMTLQVAVSKIWLTGLTLTKQHKGDSMKKILALGLATLSFSALADFRRDSKFMQKMETNSATEGVRHMFEFNVDSILGAAMSFDKSKVKGSDASNDTKANVSLNYAYGIAPLFQLGMRFNYFNGISGSSETENLDFSVGGILNNMEDFKQSAYVSLYLGAGWSQDFGANSRDDLRFATIAVGKRFPLDQFGLKHVTYTPEVAIKNVTSTTSSGLDYSQSVQLRVLQFSVFF